MLASKHMRLIWLLRGIALIIFGIVAFLLPAFTFTTLALAFSLYIFISGIITLVHGFGAMRVQKFWYLTVLMGLVEIIVGAFAFLNPLLSVVALIILIGITFLVRGVLEIVAAFDHVHTGATRTLLVIAGILAALAGIVVLLFPLAGSVGFTWVLGVYAVIAGIISISLAATSISLTAPNNIKTI